MYNKYHFLVKGGFLQKILLYKENFVDVGIAVKMHNLFAESKKFK